MPQIFALLVGINEYHPKSGVGNLRGCVNDINAFGEFLKKQYPALLPAASNIAVLTNAQATRENVIKAFTEQLCNKAKAGDFAIFYYSGHGSTEPGSAEFLKYDSSGQNETLVCHDSRCAGKQDLADKELAVLLSRITDKAQKLVILDSCHSGSATRSVAEVADQGLRRFQAARFNSDGGGGRSVKDYLLPNDSFYIGQGKNAMPPSSPHILLSACSRDQVAMETSDQRGLFSKTMIQILTESGGRISYADLQQRVRASIAAGGGKQTPVIEPFETFSASTQFLGTRSLDQSKHFVTYNPATKCWEIQFGAVHGMPLSGAELASVRLRLLRDTPGKVLSRTTTFDATVTSVSTSKSVLAVKETATKKMVVSATYVAEFLSLPRTSCVPVWLNGQPAVKTQFESWYNQNPNGALVWVTKPTDAKYELRLTGKQILVNHIASNTLVSGFDAHSQEAANYAIGILNHIEKWERIWRLSKAPESLDKSKFTVRFCEINRQLVELSDWTPDSKGKMNVGLDIVKENNAWTPAYYKVEVQNNSSQDVYVTLLFLSRFYDVQAYYPSQILKKGTTITELKKGGLSILDEKLDAVTNRFKVIFSTEPVVSAAFTQPELALGSLAAPSRSALSKGDAIDFDFAPTPKEDWFVQNIDVTVNRCIDDITPGRGVNIADAGITIAAHPSFKGKVSLSGSKGVTRSIDSDNDFELAATAYGGEVVNLTNASRNTEATDRTILQITDIQNAASLKQNPLDIRISQPLKANENLIAVTRDASTGLILPVGIMTKLSANESQLKISALPPAEEAVKTKSLGGALKMLLLKLVTKDDDKLFLLRRVVYKPDGSCERVSEGVKEAVAAAKKVLLVTHGIIGDTAEQAAAFQFAVTKKNFQTVLTFDYENLNTKIEDIAGHLNRLLKEAGFSATDNKELHIVAHSMGGLVSRYMIENLGGNVMVNRLIMCGTPNGGSVFGKAPGAIQGLNWLLGLGLNFVPKIVGDIVGKIATASNTAMVTLGQMDPDSPFIQALAKNAAPKGTIYTIMAGNIHIYKGPDTGLLGKLFEKLEVGVGRLAYWNTENDIAVSTENIRKVPFMSPNLQYVIACHHLNYFSNPQSLSLLELGL